MWGKKFLAVAACVALSGTLVVLPTRASVVPAISEVVGRLIQLASNDGGYEASGEPTMFVDSGDSLVPIRSDAIPGEAGDIVRFAQSPGASISQSEIARARVLTRQISAAALVPNRTVTVVPITFAGSSWTAQDRAIADQVANNAKT